MFCIVISKKLVNMIDSEKKVIVSALVLNKAKSGYYRVIRNMLLTIGDQALAEGQHFIFVIQRQAIELLEIDVNKCHPNISIVTTINFNSVWFRGVFEQFAIPYLAFKYKVSLIFMPATFGLIFPVRKVVTFVHTNTSFAMNKEFRGRSIFQQFAHKFLARITYLTSSSILFTTNQTYKEYQSFVKRNLPCNIIGNGIMESLPIELKSEEKIQVENRREYILVVSQFYRLKNFNNIISALKIYNSKIDENYKQVSLIIVGTIQERDFYSELLKMVELCDFVDFKHDLTNDELNSLYKNCLFYCSMSLFEGYSLTPAEALMHGKRLLLSDIPTHREVYDGLALFVNPNDPIEIKDGIKKLCSSKEQIDMEFIMDRFSQFSFNSRILKSISDAL